MKFFYGWCLVVQFPLLPMLHTCQKKLTTEMHIADHMHSHMILKFNRSVTKKRKGGYHSATNISPFNSKQQIRKLRLRVDIIKYKT